MWPSLHVALWRRFRFQATLWSSWVTWKIEASCSFLMGLFCKSVLLCFKPVNRKREDWCKTLWETMRVSKKDENISEVWNHHFYELANLFWEILLNGTSAAMDPNSIFLAPNFLALNFQFKSGSCTYRKWQKHLPINSFNQPHHT